MPQDRASQPVVLLTLGDISGIGPELAARVMSDTTPPDCRLVVVDDIAVLRLAAGRLGLPSPPMLSPWDDDVAPRSRFSYVDLHHAPRAALAVGRPDSAAGEAAGAALVAAIELAQRRPVQAIVFAPLCKEVLTYRGHHYSDELFLLREAAGSPQMQRVVLVNGVLISGVTGHVALRDVPAMITTQSVLAAIHAVRGHIARCGLGEPRLAVAALNPHAGEHGLFGDEEERAIAPAIEAARAEGMTVAGPVPADTVFTRAFRGEFNGVVSMYHDQANIATKVTTVTSRVVLYVGGPVVLATPGHGTAFDIAGRGLADPAGLRLAIATAARIARAGLKESAR